MAARVVARAEAEDNKPSGHESILVQLDRGCGPGALFLEAARGGFLSAAAPLLVAPDAAAAAELRQLESAGVPGQKPAAEHFVVPVTQHDAAGSIPEQDVRPPAGGLIGLLMHWCRSARNSLQTDWHRDLGMQRSGCRQSSWTWTGCCSMVRRCTLSCVASNCRLAPPSRQKMSPPSLLLPKSSLSSPARRCGSHGRRESTAALTCTQAGLQLLTAHMSSMARLHTGVVRLQGWPAVARLVLPTACASSESVGDVMDALQCRVAANLTPLHLAVRSGSADLVGFWHRTHIRSLLTAPAALKAQPDAQRFLGNRWLMSFCALCMKLQVRLLLGWASAGGYEWSVNVPGPHGITPLHLAALLPDCTIAELLVGMALDGAPPLRGPTCLDACTPS